jgi:hypothetical protein
MSKGKKILPAIKCVALLISFSVMLSGSIQAAPITIGNMSYDSSVNADVIVDSANNRDWLRWDVLTGKTHTETLNETQIGDYVGWHLADNIDAQLFTDALLPLNNINGNSCKAENNSGCWTDRTPSHDYHQLLGDSHKPGNSYDTVFFESYTNGRAGLIQSTIDPAQTVSTIAKKTSEFSITTASNLGVNNDIGWLLYRDHPLATNSVTVDEPDLAFILFMGIAILLLYRRKYNKQ